MKHLFTIVLMAFTMLVACEKPVENTKPSITLHCEKPYTVGCEGGAERIGYLISNPVEGARLTAAFSSYWVYDIEVHENYISFVVERNTEKTSRTGDIKLNYGGTSLALTITQEGKSSDYDYEFKATNFGGEYYGNRGEDNYNYYVVLGNAEVSADNSVPNATYYCFDIYAARRGGDNPVLPNGTYNLDPMDKNGVGTFSKSGSKALVIDANGEPMTEYEIVSGSITVTDGKFDAVVYMSDGTSHHVAYEGNLAITNAVNTPDYGSKLTADFTFSHPAGYVRLFYYGDEFGIGKDYWSIALMEDSNAMNGDYFQIKVFTDNVDGTIDSLAGTYGPCSDLDPQPRSFISGLLEGNMYIGSQYYVVSQGFIDNKQGAPIYDGTIAIEVANDNLIVTLDCVDDNGHKIAGQFESVWVEFYDRSK